MSLDDWIESIGEGVRRPLGRSATLPAAAYTSPDVYGREVERIFRKEWLCVGRLDQIPDAGDYFTVDLAGDRLVAVRGDDGAVRVMSRICRHRAAEVVSGSGRTSAFRCPYHAWTYRLDGRLAGAPYMDDVEGFDRTACRLPEVRSEVWEGWVFVCFDPEAPPLGPRLAPLARLLARYRMSGAVATEAAVFDSPFNWKVLVENFMEAYHHIAIHRDTLEPLFPARLSEVPDAEGPYSVLVMPPREDGAPRGLADLPVLGDLEAWQEKSLVAVAVFPFHLFALGADSLTWYHVLPETHDRFRLRIYTCVGRATLEDPARAPAVEALRSLTCAVHEQDIVACEAVWAGLTSRSAAPGRLSCFERSIWQLNQWWLDRMTGRPGSRA